MKYTKLLYISGSIGMLVLPRSVHSFVHSFPDHLVIVTFSEFMTILDFVCCSECGCGSGDSGCKVCGCCRVCAGDKDIWEGMFQVEQEDMDMVEGVREKAQKLREKKVKKKRKLDRENSMGLKLLFGGAGSGGWCVLV